MTTNFTYFAEEHIEDAAKLIALRHKEERAKYPFYPQEFVSEESIQNIFISVMEQSGTLGVAAFQNEHFVGCLLGKFYFPTPKSAASLFNRPRSIRVGSILHAAKEEKQFDIYRAMYGAIAPLWLSAGCFSHYVYVSAIDTKALEAWFSMGFGKYSVFGIRETTPIESNVEIEIRQATPDDIDIVTRLLVKTLRYQAGGPVFHPYLPETRQDITEIHEHLLSNEESAAFLAIQDEEVLGIQTIFPHHATITLPAKTAYLQYTYTEETVRNQGVNTALLSKSLSWAREKGFSHCAASWPSANIPVDQFCRSHKVQPMQYGLFRHIDERISWAGGGQKRIL